MFNTEMISGESAGQSETHARLKDNMLTAG